jgi:hypothetical protein
MAGGSSAWINTAGADWKVVGIAVVDASADGDVLYYDNEMESVTVKPNTVFELTDIIVSLNRK